MDLRAALFGLVVLLGATTSACTKPGAVSLEESPRSYSPKDYKRALENWTRKVELLSVDEMDNVLTVTSTFQSWDFRHAYSERYAQDYRLSPSQKKQFLDRSLAESKEFHQFYVALYAQFPRWGDLEAEEPAWIVRLVDSTGQETKPSEVHRVRRPSAMEQTYFPYTTSYRTVYRISFPRTVAGGKPTLSESAEWFGLRFAGAQGTTKVVWEVD